MTFFIYCLLYAYCILSGYVVGKTGNNLAVLTLILLNMLLGHIVSVVTK